LYGGILSGYRLVDMQGELINSGFFVANFLMGYKYVNVYVNNSHRIILIDHWLFDDVISYFNWARIVSSRLSSYVGSVYKGKLKSYLKILPLYYQWVKILCVYDTNIIL